MKTYHIWLGLFILSLTTSAPVWGESDTVDHYKKGITYSQNKNWTEAAGEFEKALLADPQNALAHANLGVALSNLSMHKEALLAFEKALSLGYDHPFLRYNRGLSFANLNLLDEAVQELETALSKDSRMVKAMYDLGILYLRQGRVEEARALADKLYKRNNHLSQKLFDQVPPEYKIASIDNGGTLSGKVTLKGPVPLVRPFHLIHAPNVEYCSRMSDGHGHRLLFDFTVSPNRELKDTVIAILGVHKGKRFPDKIQTVNIARCHADKYVIGFRNGENILLENTDPIKHEITTYEVKSAGYKTQRSNRNLLGDSSQLRQVYVKNGSSEFLIKCNLHPFLQTRGIILDNPYYAVTDAEGRFNISEIPPGTYEVMAWHPFIPTKKGTITIAAGQEARIDFEFDGNDEKRRLYHDDIKGYRFNTWFDNPETFYGALRKDDPVEVLQTIPDALKEN